MDSRGKIELTYSRANRNKRTFAFFLDLILMIIAGLGFFTLSRFIAESTPSYKKAYHDYVNVCETSGLYKYKETKSNLVSIVSFYGDSNEYDMPTQNEKLDEALTNFYVADPINIFDGDEGKNIYENEKIKIGKKDKVDYFIPQSESDPTLVPNPVLSDKTMHNFYQKAVYNAMEYLVRDNSYLFASKYLMIVVNIIVIPISISLAMIVFEFLIPLIFFRRGYQTLGMKAFKLSLLNSRAVSPSFGAFLARFSLLWLVEIIGSLISFAIPAVVSFTMMMWRKDGQAFHDYVSGTYMVDSSQQSIYKSKEEYLKLQEVAKEVTSRDHLTDWYEKKEGGPKDK